MIKLNLCTACKCLEIEELIDIRNLINEELERRSQNIMKETFAETAERTKPPRREEEPINKIWLLTSGSGADGDAWGVISVHSTKEGAKQAEVKYEAPRERPNGSTYNFDAEVEEWDVNE